MQSYLQYNQAGRATRAWQEPEQREVPRPATRTLSKTEEDESEVFIVDWEGDDDPLNPKNWSTAKRLGVSGQLGAIAIVVCSAGAIDAAVMPQAAVDLGVSEVAETLAMGMFLIGLGAGCLISGPFSETFGRNAVYIGSLAIFAIWIMAAGLAPNFGAQIVFRFLAGFSASAPLVCCGGTIADIYNGLEKTWAFPLYAIAGFGGPILGLVIGSYIGPTTSWRWAEWSMLIATGLTLAVITLFMPETYSPILLQWKAAQLRKGGDMRYRSQYELSHTSLASCLKVALTRPFRMATEPIIILCTLYLTIVYIVLYTFLDGYPYIFEWTYEISQGLTNVLFIAMYIGVLAVLFTMPFVYRVTAREIKAKGMDRFTPEIRLWYAMLSAPAIPVSLFWMGWTARSSINVWSPIIASVFFGYGTTGVFMSMYMYIIDSYEIYAASALTFAAVVRYLASGGMTVAGLPIYENLGVAYTCTILGCASAAMVPIPYVLFGMVTLFDGRVDLLSRE